LDFHEYVRARSASDVVDFDQLLDLRRAAIWLDHESIVEWLRAEQLALGSRPAGRVAMVMPPGVHSDALAREIQAELGRVLVESAVFADVAEADAWLTAQRERNLHSRDESGGEGTAL
jgi:hypothetical protein